jgi:competence protein ComEC
MNSSPSRARAPLALAAAAFSAGILLSAHLQRPASLWALSSSLLAACALVALAFRARPVVAQLAAALAFVAAGGFASACTPVPHITTPPPEFLNIKVQVTGYVTNDGALLAGGTPRERFDLQTDRIHFLDEHEVVHDYRQPVGLRLTVYLPDMELPENDLDKIDSRLSHLVYGQRVDLQTKLRLPRNFRNPGAFDYEGYLHGLGISAVGSVKADDIVAVDGAPRRGLGYWRSAVRRSILEHITRKDDALWKGDDCALFAAMIIGHDSLLLRDVREEFQETGVYHLLVVSGMNVGLLAFAVFWLSRRLRAPEWAASLVTIALAVFYAEVAGMGVPIQRAVLMLSLFLMARLIYRGRAPLNATGFAALVVLVLTPNALFEAGFQLTFLALLAIFGISLPILERTSEPCRMALRHLDSTSYDLTLSPQFAQLRLDLRLIVGRLVPFIGTTPARWFVSGVLGASIALYELIVVSSITQAALVLPMRAYFHRAAIIGMPANIFVLPLAGVLLNSAVAAIALSYLSMPLARIPALLASACLHWTLACLRWLSRFHISQWRVSDPGMFLWLAAAAGITLAFLAVRRKRMVAFAGLAALFLTAALAAFHLPAPRLNSGALEITTIDVGQGDSILVVSPEGETMLIDAGGSVGPVRSEFDFGEDVVSPYLWSRELETLDVVALTHAHGDHIGGLARVIENFHPRELWLGINPRTPALDHLLEVAAANHVRIRKHAAGETFYWHGTGIRVLSPPPDWQPKPEAKNDDSLTLLISYGKTSALLAGDVEKKMEKFVATESPRADLLKVAHHGSATSTTPELLAAVQPRFAVISVGAHNSFDHPRPDVLARLQQAHVRTYRTDMLGATTFFLDGKAVIVKTAADF